MGGSDVHIYFLRLTNTHLPISGHIGILSYEHMRLTCKRNYLAFEANIQAHILELESAHTHTHIFELESYILTRDLCSRAHNHMHLEVNKYTYHA